MVLEVAKRMAQVNLPSKQIPLRYTLDNNRLTQEQREFYEKNGYIVFPRFIPQYILDKCHKRFDDLASGKIPHDMMTLMYDIKDRKALNKIQNITHDVIFGEYFEYPRMLDIIEAFTGPSILAIHSMLIAKPPDAGYGTSKHPPHQDLYYFPLRPADRIVAAWTAMEPCDHENGCLYVAPGSHKLDHLFEHDYPKSGVDTVNKYYHGIQDIPESIKWIDLEMNVGDTVFFHPLLIHGSGVNVSNRTRRAISGHYSSAQCTYIDVNTTVQKRISDEILEDVRKKVPGVSLTYEDIWKFKARLVRGVQSSL